MNIPTASVHLNISEFKKHLEVFLDWCVLRQQYPNRLAIVKTWCEYNWPDATDEEVNSLFEKSRERLTYKAN